MDGESREGKMIEDPLEEILVQGCSVFFSAEICSLNGIIKWRFIRCLFFEFFAYILFYISSVYILILRRDTLYEVFIVLLCTLIN